MKQLEHRNIKTALQNRTFSDKIEVRESPIEGAGLFARKNLRKGEIAFVARGKLTEFHVYNDDDSQVGPNWLGIADDLWLDPAEGNPYAFINHSCNPNIGIRGQVTFVARRPIRKGEELTFDYSIAEGDMLWHLPKRCRCGEKNCRGKIRSVQFLPPSTYRSYLPYIPKYFQSLYSMYNARKA